MNESYRQAKIQDLLRKKPQQSDWIHIATVDKSLWLCDCIGSVLMRAQIATAINGLGEKKCSYKTPRRWHQIYAKIGDGAPKGSVFIARAASGEFYTPEKARKEPQRDWILTRILWLEGLEMGFNLGADVDTRMRYIYIHGAPFDRQLEHSGSKGCIQMYDQPLIDLFNQVQVGTKVYIDEYV